MSYSFQSDFSLRFGGEEAFDFIGNAARTWPPLFERVPGVTGTLLLSNSFALAGPYEYRWRVDLERPSSLKALGAAFLSDDPEWRSLMHRWYESRTSVRGRLTETVNGDKGYASANYDDALVHVVVRSRGDRGVEVQKAVRGASAVRAVQETRTVLTAGRPQSETWLRLGGLEDLDELAKVAGGSLGSFQLYQEVRELAGGLIVAA